MKKIITEDMLPWAGEVIEPNADELSPLESFIWDHEPIRDPLTWRTEFADAINEAIERYYEG